MKRIRIFIQMFFLIFSIGCSHALQITNLESFAVPVSSSEKKIEIGITPFAGNSEGLWYYNSLIERLKSDHEIESLKTNYVVGESKFEPNYIISIDPVVNYKSSGWNFLINWPGFLVFTPAWNGYVYYADIRTKVTIYDSNGRELKRFEIETPYSIREAEFDRTVWTGLTWFEVSSLAFLGGIYNATNYDADVTPQFHLAVRENYANFVVEKIMQEIRQSRL